MCLLLPVVPGCQPAGGSILPESRPWVLEDLMYVFFWCSGGVPETGDNRAIHFLMQKVSIYGYNVGLLHPLWQPFGINLQEMNY